MAEIGTGQEQFEKCPTVIRNLHIIAALQPVFLQRTELIANDEFMDRGGADNPTRDALMGLLLHADRMRRHITHNPEDTELGLLIEKAVNPNGELTIGENPFGGDDVQNQSGQLQPIPFKLDGTDPNIPLNSQLEPTFIQSNGMIMLMGIDAVVIQYLRSNSRNRSAFITVGDSMRIYGIMQQQLGFIKMYLGDENRKDVVQMLPSEEPRGPQSSPNILGESVQGKNV